MNASFPRPRGVTIEVTLPRWPLNLMKLAFGLLLVLMVVAALVAMLFQTRTSSGSVTTHAAVGDVTRAGDGYRLSARFERSGDGPALDLSSWTLLFDDGSVAGGVLVSGPDVVAADGTAEVVIEFPARDGAAPAWARLAQRDQPPMSFPVALAPTR